MTEDEARKSLKVGSPIYWRGDKENTWIDGIVTRIRPDEVFVEWDCGGLGWLPFDKMWDMEISKDGGKG